MDETEYEEFYKLTGLDKRIGRDVTKMIYDLCDFDIVYTIHNNGILYNVEKSLKKAESYNMEIRPRILAYREFLLYHKERSNEIKCLWDEEDSD